MEEFARSELERLVSPAVQPLVFLKATFVKLVQPQNAYLSILVTLSGISILVKLLHSENAQLPILVTLSGISILVKLVQV